MTTAATTTTTDNENVLSGVPHIDLAIDVEEYSKQDIMNVVQVLKPNWRDEDTTLKRMSGGFVNLLLLCRNINDTCPGIVFRIFGESFSLLHDRQQETKNTALVSHLRLGPKLLHTFKTGFCYEFLEGETFEWNSEVYKEEDFKNQIIDEMVRWHSPHVLEVAKRLGNDIQPKPLMYIRKLLQDWPSSFPEAELDRQFKTTVPPHEKLLEAARDIKDLWNRLELTTAFCHNDVNISNMVRQRDKGKITFLDYEWAGFSSIEYDISYHLTSVHMGTAKHVSKFVPPDTYIIDWVRKYLQRKEGANAEEAVGRLVDKVKALMPTTQFVIALICVRLATLPQKEDWTKDFDYMGNAAGRFEYYFNQTNGVKEA